MDKKQEKTINIFIAYSRKDESYLKKILNFLKPVGRRYDLNIWYDGEISPGSIWDEEIKKHIHQADIILLLVSADSLASEYFYEQEVKNALFKHRDGNVKLIPIILRECLWEDAPFSNIQVLPKDGKPISSWPQEDVAYSDIVRGIRTALEEINQKEEKKRQAEKKKVVSQFKKSPKQPEEATNHPSSTANAKTTGTAANMRINAIGNLASPLSASSDLQGDATIEVDSNNPATLQKERSRKRTGAYGGIIGFIIMVVLYFFEINSNQSDDVLSYFIIGCYGLILGGLTGLIIGKDSKMIWPVLILSLIFAIAWSMLARINDALEIGILFGIFTVLVSLIIQLALKIKNRSNT